MNEIIRVKNISYDRYEELLMRRDAIRKEAFIYERAFTREFGDLILEVFRMKIECIRTMSSKVCKSFYFISDFSLAL